MPWGRAELHSSKALPPPKNPPLKAVGAWHLPVQTPFPAPAQQQLGPNQRQRREERSSSNTATIPTIPRSEYFRPSNGPPTPFRLIVVLFTNMTPGRFNPQRASHAFST
ncbi:MAG TPA: hypothetical protein VFA10_16580 [Ktedonobacteraceae bacterium]|nr:hypothetical protein [Ktedonobacteraceae bacterium]